MIAKLSGILDSVSLNTLILDVNGVGYLVAASPRTLSRVGQPGDPVSLLIETQIREDAFNLFGFLDAAEQEWFKLLTSVQGVGAKAAMAILGVCPPDQLGFAIASSDKAAVTRADGVGPKLAVRILTELKDKAGKIDLAVQKPAISVSASANESGRENGPADNNIDSDAVSALVNLGYGRSDAYAAVLQARGKANDNDKCGLQDLIRLALKELSA